MYTPMEHLVGQAIGSDTRPLTRAEIETWQIEQLRRQVRYCTGHSFFYRRKLAAAGVDRVHGLHDLASLPFTTESELRQHGNEMVCVSQNAVARIITLHSSGTTEPPKRLFFTEADLDHTLNFFHLGMGQMAAPGDRVAILLPGQTPDSTGDLLARALARMQTTGIILGLATDPQAAAQKISELQPNVLVGFPVQILALVRIARYLRLPLAPIRSVLLCSDYVPASLTQSLQHELGCEVFSHYGAVETGLGGAVDCSAHCGCHVCETNLLVEIVDPNTGMPVADGAWGEIVCTTLTRTGMPLIRYRTGDLCRLLPGPCPCGSAIRRLDRVLGRIDQVRTLDNGARLSLPDLDEKLFVISGLLDFTAALKRNGRRIELHLCLTSLPGLKKKVESLAIGRLCQQEWAQDLDITIEHAEATLVQPAKRRLEDFRNKNDPYNESKA